MTVNSTDPSPDANGTQLSITPDARAPEEFERAAFDEEVDGVDVVEMRAVWTVANDEHQEDTVTKTVTDSR